MFRLKVDPGRVTRRWLQARRKDFKDLRWFWPQVVKGVAAAHAYYWSHEGTGKGAGDSAEGWKPLKEYTEFRRLSRIGYYSKPSAEGPAGLILHWTHSLRDSFTEATGASHSVRRFFRTSMEYGSSHPLAPIHHLGENDLPVRYLLAEESSADAVVHAGRTIFYRKLTGR